MHPTTITSWALLAAKALRHQGIDSDEVFREVGLDPDLLKQAGSRYPMIKVTRLWQRAVELTSNECFGLQTATFWHPTTAHALGYTWLASDNLREAFLRLQRYVHIFNDITIIRIHEHPGEYVVELTGEIKDEDVATEAIDAGIATIVQMCRASMGEGFCPIRVELQRDPPGCVDKFNEFFRAPIRFNGDINAVYMDTALVRRGLPESNKELALANEKVAIDYLSRLKSSDTSIKAAKVLIDKLPDGAITADQVANELHLSPRTFQRRLKGENTSFSKLMDDVRKELATNYMQGTDKSVTEITYLLGFAETSTFSRAFKRWTGQSPTRFREGCLLN
ncbi:MAG: AraC family transcriptional regulator [Acidiferrobacterales bacterium]|nr:AraC family transcriptional regulator [Acidiferrobacterales bacterium]